jgi:hypothetical protein
MFSSRQSALACERHLAFVAMGGSERPDCRTISAFRQRHWEACIDVLVAVGRLAGAAGRVQWGKVSTDGTTIPGHASRHQAMSDGEMQREVERVREAIEALVPQASQQDEAEEAALGSRRGDDLPAELARREERLATMEAARRRWEARAKAAADAERQRRAEAEAERQRTGQKRRGQVPKPVAEAPADHAPSHCTAPERPIRPTNHTGGEDCGNAPSSVDATCPILVACEVTEASNDQQQAEPVAQATLATLAQAGMAPPPDESGAAQAIPATLAKGYDRERAAPAWEDCGCEPYRATGRQRHQGSEAEVNAPPPTATARLAAQGRTSAGTAWYARRTVSVEPVFGQLKAARGFRRFLRRGLEKMRGAWRLVCLGHHRLKLWRSGGAQSVASTTWGCPCGFAMALCRASCRCATAPWGAEGMAQKPKTVGIWTYSL